ncbi:MAG: hypothetical protein KDC70_05860 [Saprospiraceae bacterium]|nr:hypothetical protein [Saprospiraceae bacterium]
MKPVFPVLPLLLLLVVSPALAQEIPVDFTKNPDKPVAISCAATGRTLFFFYPEQLSSDVFAGAGNPWNAVELDSRSLEVMRSNTNASLRVGSPGGQKARVVCRIGRPDGYYVAIQFDKVCRIIRFSPEDLAMTVADSIVIGKRERLIQGVSSDSNAYIICTKKIKRADPELIAYELGDGGRLLKHRIPVRTGRNLYLDQLFNKKFQPLAVDPDMELDPRLAANPVKMFAGDRKVRFTFDDAGVGSIYTQTAAILRVATLDFDTDSLSVRAYYYTDSLVRDAFIERRSSYIYEDKVFQVYMNDEQLLLRIRDLESGKVLFTKALLREDTIEGLANSPILVPGRGLLGIEKEYRSVRRFMKRYASFEPFIQVRRAGDHYLMCIGGREKTRVLPSPIPGQGPGFSNNFGIWWDVWNPSYGYSYRNSFSFYSLVHVPTMTRSVVYYEKPLIAASNELLEEVKKPRDQCLFRIGGRYCLGYFDEKTKNYRLVTLEGY